MYNDDMNIDQELIAPLTRSESWAGRRLAKALNNLQLNNSLSSSIDMKFQQKQQQTREERRVELFSGTTKPLNETTNVQNSSYPGKVRAMFDERRRGAGIDRSQPLKPITSSGTTTKSKVKAGMHKNGINTAPSITTSNKSLSTSTLNNVRQKTIAKNDQEIKSAEQSEAENDELDGSMHSKEGIQAINKSLQNVNISSKKPINNSRNSNSSMKEVPLIKGVAKTNLAPVKIKKTPPPPAPVVSPKTLTPMNQQTSTMKETEEETPLTTALNSKPLAKKPTSAKVVKRTPDMSNADIPDGMLTCRYCNRHFLAERLPKHEAVCAKLSTAKRKVFDASEHRVRGTDAAKFVKKPPRMTSLAAKSTKTSTRMNYSSSGNTMRLSPNSALTKNNWRQKHEEFIAAIRAAKELKAHLARGGKLTDLPPPPPSENPDYIQCPHCGRRFNQPAAERHIPKCATMLHNKPKPGAAKNQPASRTSVTKRR